MLQIGDSTCYQDLLTLRSPGEEVEHRAPGGVYIDPSSFSTEKHGKTISHLEKTDFFIFL